MELRQNDSQRPKLISSRIERFVGWNYTGTHKPSGEILAALGANYWHKDFPSLLALELTKLMRPCRKFLNSLIFRSEAIALAAAKLADLVIIPCRPQAYDLETVPATQELISLAGGTPAMVVLTQIPSRGDRHEQAKSTLVEIGMAVCPQTIGSRAAFGDAGAMGQTATEYDPNGTAAEEIQLAYKYISKLLAKKREDAHEEESRLIRASR